MLADQLIAAGLTVSGQGCPGAAYGGDVETFVAPYLCALQLSQRLAVGSLEHPPCPEQFMHALAELVAEAENAGPSSEMSPTNSWRRPRRSGISWQSDPGLELLELIETV